MKETYTRFLLGCVNLAGRALVRAAGGIFLIDGRVCFLRMEGAHQIQSTMEYPEALRRAIEAQKPNK